MFRELFAFVEEERRSEGIDRLLHDIERFAFWPELRATLPSAPTTAPWCRTSFSKGSATAAARRDW